MDRVAKGKTVLKLFLSHLEESFRDVFFEMPSMRETSALRKLFRWHPEMKVDVYTEMVQRYCLVKSDANWLLTDAPAGLAESICNQILRYGVVETPEQLQQLLDLTRNGTDVFEQFKGMLAAEAGMSIREFEDLDLLKGLRSFANLEDYLVATKKLAGYTEIRDLDDEGNDLDDDPSYAEGRFEAQVERGAREEEEEAMGDESLSAEEKRARHKEWAERDPRRRVSQTAEQRGSASSARNYRKPTRADDAALRREAKQKWRWKDNERLLVQGEKGLDLDQEYAKMLFQGAKALDVDPWTYDANSDPDATRQAGKKRTIQRGTGAKKSIYDGTKTRADLEAEGKLPRQ